MNRLNQFLNLNFDGDDKPWIHSGYKLRQTIGVMGMLLPFLLFGSLYIYSGTNKVLPSISHYYFTRSGTIFTATLIVLAVFLLIYKSYEKWDFWLSTLAGIFALFVSLAPTSNLSKTCCDLKLQHAITFFSNDIEKCNPRVIFHYISAGLFFLCLAIMSYSFFTKTKVDAVPSKRKRLRNRIYRVCSVVMVGAILIILFHFNDNDSSSWYNSNQMTFWLEVIAIEAFGFAWLVKGEALLRDTT